MLLILLVSIVAGCSGTEDPTGGGEIEIAPKYSWQLVGKAGFSDNKAKYISLAIDNKGNPYVAYSDFISDSDAKAKVIKFDGNTWQAVGGAVSSDKIAEYTSLAIYNNTPYIAYRFGLGNKAAVRKLDNWIGYTN